MEIHLTAGNYIYDIGTSDFLISFFDTAESEKYGTAIQ